jgi:hypothetical protein
MEVKRNQGRNVARPPPAPAAAPPGAAAAAAAAQLKLHSCAHCLSPSSRSCCSHRWSRRQVKLVRRQAKQSPLPLRPRPCPFHRTCARLVRWDQRLSPRPINIQLRPLLRRRRLHRRLFLRFRILVRRSHRLRANLRPLRRPRPRRRRFRRRRTPSLCRSRCPATSRRCSAWPRRCCTAAGA